VITFSGGMIFAPRRQRYCGCTHYAMIDTYSKPILPPREVRAGPGRVEFYRRVRLPQGGAYTPRETWKANSRRKHDRAGNRRRRIRPPVQRNKGGLSQDFLA